MANIGPAGIALTRSSHYRQDLPKGQLYRYFVYSQANFGVFRPAGATRCTDQGQILHIFHAKFDLDQFSGGGLRPPKLKKFKFYQYNCPCTIFTKFTNFLRVLSLHNSAKYGCLISTNDKIINNLLRWGVFSHIFDAP